MSAKDNFFCLMSKGSLLTPHIRNMLFDRAQLMLREDIDFSQLDILGCWGTIKNSGKTEVIGPIVGKRFDADLMTSEGNLTIAYIVRPTPVSAQDGFWVTA